MPWPFLTVVLALACVGLHWWWHARCKRLQQASALELEKVRREQQAAFAQLQNQQEALLNSMTEGLLLLDERDQIVLANRALLQAFGIEREVSDRNVIEAFRSHELADLVRTIAREKQVLGKEITLLAPAERCFVVNGATIIGPDGNRRGAVLVFHDQTRLKQLESARKDFVANVSHELRTPLSLIQGYVETLLDGAKNNPETCSKFLETIERNAERLRLLIEDLLVISELESGRLKLEFQPVLLRESVIKVLEDFEQRAGARGVKLQSELPDLAVRADPARLEQVLGNLVDNAIKYGRAAGQVTVHARPRGDGFVELCVEDDGPGIPAEALERVFERFYRVDKARSREQGGTGLGLAIVKHIVQSHGGRAWAESKVGAGSRFYFTLRAESLPPSSRL